MTALPNLIRRMPFIFYGFAVLFFVWNLVNQYFTMAAMNPYTDPMMEGVMNLEKSSALYQALLESTYIVANGVLIQVLIAIFDRLGEARK